MHEKQTVGVGEVKRQRKQTLGVSEISERPMSREGLCVSGVVLAILIYGMASYGMNYLRLFKFYYRLELKMAFFNCKNNTRITAIFSPTTSGLIKLFGSTVFFLTVNGPVICFEFQLLPTVS